MESPEIRRTAAMPEVVQSVTLDPTTYAQVVLKPNPDVESTTLDGETVLLHLGTGRYYTLNRVGTAIWEHCREGNTISAIHQALCSRFDVSPERAHDNLVTLVNQLDQEGLLQVQATRS